MSRQNYSSALDWQGPPEHGDCVAPVESHAGAIYLFALRISGDPRASVWTAAATIAAARAALSDVGGVTCGRRWLHAIAVGLLREHDERDAVRRTDMQQYERAVSAAVSDCGMDLELTLAALPLAQRAVAVVWGIERYTVDEASALLDSTPQSVRASLSAVSRAVGTTDCSALRDVLGRAPREAIVPQAGARESWAARIFARLQERHQH